MKYLYKFAEDDIYIPFLSDEENLKINPNVKIPKYEINTFKDILNINSSIKNIIQNFILKNLSGFNKYINESNKDTSTLTEYIINRLIHFSYLEKLDQSLCEYSNYKQLDKEVRKNDLKEYIQNNFKETINKFIIESKKVNKEISNPEMVSNLYDSLGSTTQLAKHFDVDVNNRAYCFLYINGELLYSNFQGKHFELINQYLKEHSLNGYADSARYRDINQIRKTYNTELPADTPIAWGHVAYSIAYIEKYQNVSLRKVVDALLLKSKFKKIYYYNFYQQTITRLAKRA